MSMRSKLAFGLALAALAVAPLFAQRGAAPEQGRVSGRIHLPPDSPITLVTADWSESRSAERGSAAVIDLRTTLSLRNSSQRRIRGLTFLVTSQEVTPGGRASVTQPSLDVGPGENFPLRIDLRLLRPLARGPAPHVEVTLDGILFADLSFYGPNRLDSRRTLTAWEMEAQRDRRYFRRVLEAQGPDGLRKQCLASLARQAETPRLDVQLSRTPRTTTTDAGRQVQFAFLNFPDSPVEPVAGSVHVAAGLASAPKIDVVNRSRREVRSIELGWLLSDTRGREYLAGSVPAAQRVAAGARGSVTHEGTLKFSEPTGQPVAIDSITAFVSQVEFSDGSLWIPSRAALDDSRLRKALAPSAEEMRLTTIYRKRGLAALVAELQKFE